MKQITKLFLIAALLLTACEKEPVITLNSPSLSEVGAGGGKLSLSFSANRDWNISSSVPWIHVTPSSGTRAEESVAVTIACDANTEYDERSGIVTIFIEGPSQSVTIKQAACDLGIFGIHGISWTYRPGRDQLITRMTEDQCYCVLIEPAAHKLFSIALPRTTQLTEGMTLEATVTQNLDATRPAVVKLKLTVSQRADRYIVLSNAEGHTAALIVG